MPNIIEQQDLLKGLPDNRLALLLRNPDATIPPFLVAAEAQRRQAIRQQFAGDAGKESVVDSLTKQLANVPQNVQAPMQTPPRMPAPMMPQAGIAALQQAPQQPPMQAPQQMANGGMVQRYQVGGQVEPMWRLPEYGGVIPRVGDWVGGAASSTYDWATTPYSERRAQEETPSPMSDITTPDIKVPPKKPEFAFDPGQEPVPYIDLTPKKPKPPEDTTISTTSPENRDKADSAKYRSMLEELYAVEEPSNWEEAQKWFAMSAQIMNPDANLMQGLVNAGAVYSQAEAEQAAAQREADLDLRKALLQYDIGERDYAREVAANKAEAAAEFLKTRTNVATGQLDDLYRQQREVAEQIRRIDESVMKGETDPASVEGIKKALQQQFNAIGGKLSTYEGFIGETYGFPTIPTVNLQTGKIE